MSLFNNNVVSYGSNPVHLGRKYSSGNGSPGSPIMGSGSCGPGDYSMGGLSSYSYGSPYDSLAGFGQSMAGNGHMGSDGWPSPHPSAPPPHPSVSHSMQLGPEPNNSSSSSSAVAAAAALQAAMQVRSYPVRVPVQLIGPNYSQIDPERCLKGTGTGL